MIDLFIKGIIIGLSISVPLGPIGMLCIQRTINRGSKYGFVTGLGATTSDLVYALVTMFFLHFIIGFIEGNQVWIKVLVSAVIIAFGYTIYRSNPSAQPLLKEKAKQPSMLTDFMSAFGLTLTNPLIVLVLIALFARLEYFTPETTFWGYLFGLFCILLGATIWWTFLTFTVGRFRKKITRRWLKVINHVSGGVIVLIGVIGLLVTLFKTFW